MTQYTFWKCKKCNAECGVSQRNGGRLPTTIKHYQPEKNITCNGDMEQIFLPLDKLFPQR